MLQRLRVRNFKSLREVSADLAQLSILFGPNGSGKSNFLEAIQLLSWIGNARTLQDALGSPLPVRGFAFEALPLHPDGPAAQFEQGSGTFTIESDLATADGGYRYRVAPRLDYRTGELGIADEYLARLGVAGKPKWTPAIECEGDVIRVRRKGKGSRPREERIGLNHSVLSDRSLTGNGYAWLDHVRDELANWRTYYFEPKELMRRDQPRAAVRDIGARGESMASFLHYLKSQHPKHADAAFRILRAIVPGVEDLSVELNEALGTLNLTVRQNGVPCSARVVSEGTLRVLALAAVAVNPWAGSVVSLEEPENGVHPRRLQRIANLLVDLSADRQVIVSTHSPILVDAVLREIRENGAADRTGLFNVRLDENATVIEPFETTGPLYRQSEILEALADGAEDAVFEGLVLRGLVDE